MIIVIQAQEPNDSDCSELCTYSCSFVIFAESQKRQCKEERKRRKGSKSQRKSGKHFEFYTMRTRYYSARLCYRLFIFPPFNTASINSGAVIGCLRQSFPCLTVAIYFPAILLAAFIFPLLTRLAMFLSFSLATYFFPLLRLSAGFPAPDTRCVSRA